MNIELAKGERIVISGSGARFLHLKARLVGNLSNTSISHEGVGRISFPITRAMLVAELLLNSGCEITPEAYSALSKQRDRLLNHLSSRQRILDIVEGDNGVTGDAYWDMTLDPKQGIAVNAMVEKWLQGLCLFDEQGTGKTIITIAAFDLLRKRGDIDILLVVCPRAMLGEWPVEFHRFAPSYKTVLVEGDRYNKFSRMQQNADVFIINFEGISPLLISLKSLCSCKRALLAVDESFFVKNPDAIRSEALRELRPHCIRAYALCGTPAPNSPEDIIHQFDIADGGITFEGYRNSKDSQLERESISQRIAERGIYLRRLKEEVLPELPEKHFNVVQIELSGKQRELYERARSELVLLLRRLDNKSFRRNLALYLQKRAVLLQICVSPRLIDPLFSEEPAKYKLMDILVDRLINEGKKVVIWSFYRGTIEEISKRYVTYGLAYIDGSVTSTTSRRQAVEGFQKNPDVRIFLGNPAAAGAGLTLHAASNAIYLSFSNQAAHYLQSLDRIHRRGQVASRTDYHLLVCKGTIEENEIKRLRQKERQQQLLLGDKAAWPTSLDDALSELEGEQ